MAVDWGMGVVNPQPAFAAGSEYVDKLYNMQAQKRAAGKIVTGDYRGAAADVASRGDIKGATALTNQATATDAGAQYASGDYAGAAGTLAKGGDLQGAETLATRAQTSADQKAAAFQKQQEVLQRGVPFLTQALQQGGDDPAIASQAFDMVAPHLVGAGTDPAEVAKQKEAFLANPQQWIQAHGAMAAKKYSFQKNGDDIAVFDEANPSAGPVFTLHGDNPNDWEVKNIIVGDKEQTVSVNKKTGETKPVAGGQPGARFNPATQIRIDNQQEQSKPDAEAIKNDVRIWLASKGTIQPQYAFGAAGAPSRQMFDTEKNNIMKQMNVSPEDVASGRAARVADQASLTQLTKMQGGVEAASNTMKNSIRLASELIGKGGATGQSPIINRWIQAGRRSVLGDPDVATFNNHLDTVADEYAKIMGGGVNGSAAATDSARADAHARINKADNAQTLKQVLAGLIQEAEGRNASNAAQVETVKARLAGYGSGAASPAPVQAPTAPPTQSIRIDKNGQIIP